MVRGKIHHFGVIGFSNGLAVMGDRETDSHWDHITGEAFDGSLAGEKLEVYPIRMTTVRAALSDAPGIEIYFSTYFSWVSWISQKVYPRFIERGKLWMPPVFHFSMKQRIDARLPRQTQGLGVVSEKRARYYPIHSIPGGGIEDDWNGRLLLVRRNEQDNVPVAMWKDTGEMPMQLLTRWYGFSFTYPGCDIWGELT